MECNKASSQEDQGKRGLLRWLGGLGRRPGAGIGDRESEIIDRGFRDYGADSGRAMMQVM